MPKVAETQLPLPPPYRPQVRPPDPRGRYGFHEDGIEFLSAADRPRALLADEMRLGKSRQAILAVRAAIEQEVIPDGPVLVVAPAMVLDFDTWTEEHSRWAPELDVRQRSYHSLVDRVPKLGKDGKPELTKAGQPKLVYVPRLPADVKKTRYAAVIFDEAQHLKGVKCTWAETAQHIRADRVILLSGTPFPNWAHELYIPLRILRPEDAHPGGLLGSRWRWIEQWFRLTQRRGAGGRVVSRYGLTGQLLGCTPACRPMDGTSGGCAHWEEFRQSELRDLWLRRTWQQVLPDLPSLVGVDSLIRVSMTTKQRTAYRQLKRDLLATLEDGTTLLAWNKGGLLTQLRKVSTGLDVVAPGVYESGKLDAMESRLAERTRPTLVLAHFHDTLTAIESRLDRMGLRWVEVSGRTPSREHRSNARKRFQAGDVAVMVGQTDAIAEGANLSAGDLAITVEHSWRPHANRQAWHRLMDPNDETPSAVDRLVTRDSVDAQMQELLHAKTLHSVSALPPREFARLL